MNKISYSTIFVFILICFVTYTNARPVEHLKTDESEFKKCFDSCKYG
jgi:hypothetical protein